MSTTCQEQARPPPRSLLQGIPVLSAAARQLAPGSRGIAYTQTQEAAMDNLTSSFDRFFESLRDGARRFSDRVHDATESLSVRVDVHGIEKRLTRKVAG